LYGEIVLRTHGQHRLVGYGEKYLGAAGKKITGAIIIFEFYGAMLAYIIAGGHFLNLIFGGSDYLWAIIFSIFGALVVLLGLRVVSLSEFIMTIFLIAIPIIFIFKGAPLLHFANLSKINWN
jgi:amino acid permease